MAQENKHSEEKQEMIAEKEKMKVDHINELIKLNREREEER